MSWFSGVMTRAAAGAAELANPTYLVVQFDESLRGGLNSRAGGKLVDIAEALKRVILPAQAYTYVIEGSKINYRGESLGQAVTTSVLVDNANASIKIPRDVALVGLDTDRFFPAMRAVGATTFGGAGNEAAVLEAWVATHISKGMGGGYRKHKGRKHRKSHRKNRNNRKTRRN